MNLEFIMWAIGVLSLNFWVTVPLYMTISIIVNKLKIKNSDFIILSLNFSIVMVLMILLESFTIINTITIFYELLLLNWIGNTLYFKKNVEE